MQTQKPKPRSVNRLVGKQPSIGYLPANQLPFWIGFILVAALLWQFFNLTLAQFLVTAFLPCIVFWALTGQKEWKFLEKFHAPRHWGMAKVRCQWRKKSPLPYRAKQGKRKVKHSRKTIVLHPLEDALNLVCYGQINLQNIEAGFEFSERHNLAHHRRQEFRFTFGFRTAGIHSTLSEAQAEAILERMETAAKELPPGERLTFEYCSVADDRDRQVELDDLLESQTNRLAELLLFSQKVRSRELAKSGLRQLKQIRILGTYTVTPTQQTALDRDFTTKLLKVFANFAEWFEGEKEEADTARLQKMISLAFTEGFLRLESILTTLMGLEIEPLTAQELWESDYAELHTEPAPPVPQLLILDEQGLHCKATSEIHATSILLRGEKGQSAIPVAARNWIYLPCKRKYAGFMQFGKPSAFPSARGQVRYLWNPIARNRLRNLKFITEISTSNRSLQKFNLERLTRNSKELSMRALGQKTVDVSSDMKTNEAIEARQALERGSTVITVASGVWLYRNNPAALEQDFSYLTDCLSTADSERAYEITENLWLQSLPCVWDGLLTKPYDRRDYYLSHEAPGLLPLVAPQTGDPKGLEFLTLEGGTPVHLDPFTQLMHLAFYATTRGGKSVLLGELIFGFYLRNIPVVGFDFPRPTDGTSSFSDLTAILQRLGAKVAYNDTGTCANNLIEMPDLRHVSNEKERRDAIIDFQIDAIVVIVLGEAADAMMEKSVRSLVSQSLQDFHATPEIQTRYEAAISAGFGTPAWEATPTLWDYLAFAESWLANHLQTNQLTVSDSIREATGQILEQLRGCLKSGLGRAIARPSSFQSDVSLLIFALRGLRNRQDAAVLALSGYSALLRRALESSASAFVIDESPILFEFPAIARIVGQLCANGLKWGVRAIISAQTVSTIYNSAAGKQIIETITTTLIGYIKPSAVESFVELLGYDREIITQCATPGFEPSGRELRSHWIICKDKTYTEVGFYPSAVLLALTANNMEEQAARTRVMEAYSDPCDGVAAFSNLYASARRQGLPMSEIQPQLLLTGTD